MHRCAALNCSHPPLGVAAALQTLAAPISSRHSLPRFLRNTCRPVSFARFAHCLVLCALVSISSILCRKSAAQQPGHESSAAVDVPDAPTAESEGEPRHRLQWTFPRFRTWQYAAVGAQTAANLTFELADVPSAGEHWRTPLPMDLAMRDAILPKSDEGRARYELVGDVLWYTTQFYTVLIDSLLVPLAFDNGNTDVAFQMTMINWQALGLTGIITRIAHHTVPRARPRTYGCSDEPGADFPCKAAGPGFFSGHVSMTTAGAALACAHHAALPIYGENAAGAITCALLSASAIGVGIARIGSDKHWFTDILAGHIVGATVGFGLPWLLHYQHRITPDLAWLGVRRAAWIPWATEDSASLALFGAF
jgi:membrane-associated phospholipid phosphatase